MEQQLYDFLSDLMIGAVAIFTYLFDGIPGGYDAILWAAFVMLIMNLIILPIRGFGMSDRALAKDVAEGRKLSVRAAKDARKKGG